MVLTDGAAGNERQALALAAAMGLRARAHVVRLSWPWSWLAPHLRAGAWGALPPELREAVTREPPRLAIGCGRAAALATAVLRRRTGCFAVQILDPRASPAHWDVIVAPAHDGLRGDGVIQMLGAMNDITPATLRDAAAIHAGLERHPAPRTAVLVGGSNRAQRIDRGYIATLLAHLARWHAQAGGSFLISTSRRTDAALVPMLREFLAGCPGELWTGKADGPNPYLGYLAHADRIVVTPDSVNLASEACATGKPVYVHASEPLRGKLAGFHRALAEAGHTRPLRDAPEDWSPVPLLETGRVTDEVWRRYRAKFPAASALPRS